MINLYKQDGETLYGIKEFLLDSPQDLSELPTNVRIGSSAIVIQTGQTYILNGYKKWVPFGGGGSSTPGGSGDFNQFDSDGDGIIDYSEEANSITLYEL